MSRWIDQFDAHPFQDTWSQIIELSETIEIDDETVTTDVQELARFTKLVCYLDELIKGCDPELVPLTTWTNFQSQSSLCLSQPE